MLKLGGQEQILLASLHLAVAYIFIIIILVIKMMALGIII